MKFYFSLQYKRICRHLQAAGFNSYLGLVLIVLLFFALSYAFFERVPYPQYVYPFLAWSVVNAFGGIQRNEFLKNCFSEKDYPKIRLIENLIAVTPFFLFLIFKQEYLLALSIHPIAAGISCFNKVNRFQVVMPTPFYKYPFEFTMGFRQYYWLFAAAYLLTIISLVVGNFNIGAFCLLFIFLSCLGFYSKPEPLFYIWIHAATPAKFLKQKMGIAVLYSLVLSLPIFLSLLFFYPDNARIVLLFEALGIVYIFTVLLGKYAYYPSEVNVIPMILITLSIFLPPISLAVIPYFYFKAKQNLQYILT
ncbi:MAG: hypothetical protein AB8B69_07665 [Chitinophagales bacterium]